MKSVRPYLLRALVDWIVDNRWTPYVAIACDVPGVDVPTDSAADGKLVLNVSANATRNFSIDDTTLSVDCRFRGKPVHISVPVGAVVAVYARENGQGMAFEAEADAPPADQAETPKPSGPKLKLVK